MSKPSSTFSFEGAPALRRTAIGVGVCVLIALVALELGARALGHRPHATDDDALLCLHWDRVHQPNAFVVLGASRSRAGFSEQVFRERHPERPLVNLTVAGACPLAALARLAEDPQFRGTVLYDVAENCLIPQLRQHQARQIEICKNEWSRGKAVNRWLRLQLETRLALMHPRLGLSSIAAKLWSEHRLPEPEYYVSTAARFDELDLSRVGPALGAHRVARLRAEHRRHPPPTPEQWLAEARLTEQYIQRIQARGGRVTVVRFPTSGEFWQLDQRAYPRERYWDAFASFSAASFVHFRDLPTRDLTCGDQSHLDTRDAPTFTRALLDEMDRLTHPQ